MDYNDEWLYDSIKSYRTLNMYDLQMQPQHLMEIDKERLCLIGRHPNGNKTEILCVQIPEKLYLSGEKQDRCMQNDFEITSGGFIDKSIIQTAGVLNGKKIIASIKDNPGFTIFNIDNLKSETILNDVNSTNFDICPSKREILTISDCKIITFDVETQKTTEIFASKYSIDDCCYFGPDHFAFFDQTRGSILIFDNRKQSEICIKDNQPGNGFQFASDFVKNRIMCVNNEGAAFVYDTRFPNSAVIEKNLVFDDSTSEKVKIRLHDERFSISGFDSSVFVYDIIAGNDFRQLFKHIGHKDEFSSQVTDHMWLKHISYDFLISCAENGSLHCWEFVEKC